MAGRAERLTQAEARRLMSEHRFLKSCASGYVHRANAPRRRRTTQENERDCIARTKLAAQDVRNYTLQDWKIIATRARRQGPPPVEMPVDLNSRAKNLLRSIVRKQKDYATARQRYLNMRHDAGAGALEIKQHADRMVRAYRDQHGMDGHTWEHPEYREPIVGAALDDDDLAAGQAAADVGLQQADEDGIEAAEEEEEAQAEDEAEDPSLVADRNALRIAVLGLDGGMVDPEWDVDLWTQSDVVAAKEALDRRAALDAAGLEVLPDGTALPKRNSKGSISPGCRGKPGRTAASCVFPCAWKRGKVDSAVMCRSARTTRHGFNVGKRAAAAPPKAAEDVE